MARELETPADGASPNARVVVEQRASIPDDPVIPNTARNIAVGLALGVLFGIGLAVLLDLLDNTVKDRQTLEEITGVGLVGSIPLDKERRNEPAIIFDKDNSAIAEAFRKLRTNLQFLAVDNPPRVIVVTSSMPNEGKIHHGDKPCAGIGRSRAQRGARRWRHATPQVGQVPRLGRLGRIQHSAKWPSLAFGDAAENAFSGIDRSHFGSCPAEPKRATRFVGSPKGA